ncbi:MAG TPA: fasciclin domain-containing protein [Candidatus Sulfotelmatobacter sp.]|nr:fasciclin domain-containing protein [Candidatus Sulfotelmatobacter sp.]
MPLTRAAACRSMAAALFALSAAPLAAGRALADGHALAVEGHQASILDAVSADPQLSTFTAALQASGLATTLGGSGTSYTVFAPSDEAFRAWAGGNDPAAAVRAASPAALRAMLQHHIVDDVLPLALDPGSLGETYDAQTEAGDKIHVDVDSRGVAVDGVRCGRDLRAANGEVRVIGKVLADPVPAAAS